MAIGRTSTCYNPDALASLGLLGVVDSLGYRIAESERHIHGWDRRWGVAVTPNAEVHVADLLGPGVLSFQATTGNNTWGSWLQVLGSSDTPAQSGSVKYDLHNLLVSDSNFAGVYYIQIAFGESADLAAKITAKTYTALIYNAVAATSRAVSIPVMTRRQTAGTKAWVRIMVPSQNGKTLNFYIGGHEYEG